MEKKKILIILGCITVGITATTLITMGVNKYRKKKKLHQEGEAKAKADRAGKPEEKKEPEKK